MKILHVTFSKILLKYISKNWVFFGFPVVQWLGLCASTEGGLGSIPSWRSRIPQAAWCRQKKKKKKNLAFFPKLERKLFGSAFTLAIIFTSYLSLPSHPPESYKLDLPNLHTQKCLSFSYQWVILSLFWITETCENLIKVMGSLFLETEGTEAWNLTEILLKISAS